MTRIRNNMTSLHGKHFKWSQAKEVFCPWIDPQGLLLFIWVVANEVVNGSAIFIKLVTQSYGFGTLNTILLGVPTGSSPSHLYSSTLFIAAPNEHPANYLTSTCT